MGYQYPTQASDRIVCPRRLVSVCKFRRVSLQVATVQNIHHGRVRRICQHNMASASRWIKHSGTLHDTRDFKPSLQQKTTRWRFEFWIQGVSLTSYRRALCLPSRIRGTIQDRFPDRFFSFRSKYCWITIAAFYCSSRDESWSRRFLQCFIIHLQCLYDRIVKVNCWSWEPAMVILTSSAAYGERRHMWMLAMVIVSRPL